MELRVSGFKVEGGHACIARRGALLGSSAMGLRVLGLRAGMPMLHGKVRCREPLL